MKKFISQRWRSVTIAVLLIVLMMSIAVPAMAEVVIVRPPPSFELDDLTDVDAVSPGDGAFLVWNGTEAVWTDQLLALNLSDLGDVDVSSPGDWQVLAYLESSEKWVDRTWFLDYMANVEIVGEPADGAVLTYNDGLTAWEDQMPGVAGLWEIDGSETQLITADEIDMQSKLIINLLDPSNNQDAATKKYVDDEVAGVPAALWEVDGTETQLIIADAIDMQSFDLLNVEDITLDQDIVFQTSNDIRADTADGSDNQFLKISGGGSASTSRGAVVILSGNEDATYFGRLLLYSGTNAAADIVIAAVDTLDMNVGNDWDVDIVDNLDIDLQGTAYIDSVESMYLTSGDITRIRCGPTQASDYVYLYKLQAVGPSPVLRLGASTADLYFDYMGSNDWMIENESSDVMMFWYSDDVGFDDNVYIGNSAAHPTAADLMIDTVGGSTSGSYMRWNSSNDAVYYYSSSERYKDNITPFNDDWYTILELEPKVFNDMRDADSESIGFIAEEADALGLTYLVGYQDRGTLLETAEETGEDIVEDGNPDDMLPDTINYELITLYLQQIIKDQQATIETLEAEIQAIKEHLGL